MSYLFPVIKICYAIVLNVMVDIDTNVAFLTVSFTVNGFVIRQILHLQLLTKGLYFKFLRFFDIYQLLSKVLALFLFWLEVFCLFCSSHVVWCCVDVVKPGAERSLCSDDHRSHRSRHLARVLCHFCYL